VIACPAINGAAQKVIYTRWCRKKIGSLATVSEKKVARYLKGSVATFWGTWITNDGTCSGRMLKIRPLLVKLWARLVALRKVSSGW